MSVSNGQLANQATFNNAFMSRTANDNTTGIKSLENASPASGSFVTNPQRDINGLNSYTGRPSNGVYNTLPTWPNDIIGAAGDDLTERIIAILAHFDATTGHNHDGSPGSGGPISATDLDDINQLVAEYQYSEFNAATGSSVDVSTLFTGKTPGGDQFNAGVITTGLDNRVSLIDTANGTQIEDAGGQRVYGRLTWAASVWTLSFYTNEAGTETAHTLAGSTDLGLFYREVFTLATRPTIPADVGQIGSLDMTADVVDASTTQRGVVSTGTQSFAGAKTFTGAVTTSAALNVGAALNGVQENNSSLTGSAQTLPAPTVLFESVSNASLTSLKGITAVGTVQFFALSFQTGSPVSLLNEAAGETATNRILTGTGADLEVEDGATLWIARDVTANRWRVVGGAGGGGGGGFYVPYLFTTSSIVATEDGFQRWKWDDSNPGTLTSIDWTAMPDGGIITFLGTGDDTPITILHNNVGNGWVLNGDWIGYRGHCLTLQWDADANRAYEVSRT